jgi:hypothetical protein
MSDHKDRIEQTIEVFVYAPIGVGLDIRDMTPTFVNMFVARGRAEIDRRQAQVQQRTTTARSVGQVAVTFGVPMVRQRVEREVDSARQRGQSFLGLIGGSDGSAKPDKQKPAPRPATTPAAAVRKVTPPQAGANGNANAGANGSPAAETNGAAVAAPTNGSAAAGDALPIPGYDALSASQVVERLTGLSTEELDAVRTYEGTHRNRRTILGKIDQISA